MTRVLFVGGSRDGETVDVPESRQVVQVLAPAARPWAVGIPTAIDSVDDKIETYTRQRLRGEQRTFEVFAPSHWSGDDLICHLLTRAVTS